MIEFHHVSFLMKNQVKIGKGSTENMITKYKYKSDIPYSLHDMIIKKIRCNEDSVKLLFKHGYVSTTQPYPQVKGNITIQGVDQDFSVVWLLSKYGRHGKFKGRKMSLKKFLKKYKKYSFEVVDELYGYNSVQYSGYLSLTGSKVMTEMTLSIYHFGEIVYKTEE